MQRKPTAYCTESDAAGPTLQERASTVNHPFLHAEFLTTAADWHQLPVDGAPEVAFAGRSNAGKSSAINALAQRTRLAFVSKTPGRTQNINFFRVRSGALLADLPGYGYAEVPAAIRRHWQQFIARYLAERVPLAGLVLVMDARRGITDLDRQMLDWFLPSLRPTHILLTKADKFTVAEQRRILGGAQIELERDYAAHADRIGIQLFSATRKLGLDQAEEAVGGWLAPFATSVQEATTEKERPRHQGE
jgi:GTP-binding protein